MDFEKKEEMIEAGRIMKAICHQLRLRILYSLREGEKNVTAIVNELKESQAVVSQSLKLLRTEKIVDTRRDGVKIYYKIVKKGVFSILDCLAERKSDLSK